VAKLSLRVLAIGEEIIVTLPGSIYRTVYWKPQTSAQLVSRSIPPRDEPRYAMSLSHFLIEAWRLADHKARELKWFG
jgi:hypothetical protein